MLLYTKVLNPYAVFWPISGRLCLFIAFSHPKYNYSTIPSWCSFLWPTADQLSQLLKVACQSAKSIINTYNTDLGNTLRVARRTDISGLQSDSQKYYIILKSCNRDEENRRTQGQVWWVRKKYRKGGSVVIWVVRNLEKRTTARKRVIMIRGHAGKWTA